MELESLKCIVRYLEGVIVVRPTYVLFLLETVSQGTFEQRYDICPIKKLSGGGRYTLGILFPSSGVGKLFGGQTVSLDYELSKGCFF